MSEDDSYEGIIEADLGLGDGLKPGGIKIDSVNSQKRSDIIGSLKCNQCSDVDFGQTDHDKKDSDEEYQMCLMPIQAIMDLKSQYSHLVPKGSRCTETKYCDSDNMLYDGRYLYGTKQSIENVVDKACKKCSDDSSNESVFPVYADVPYGTSIRQQKELFKHNLEAIQRKKCQIYIAAKHQPVDKGLIDDSPKPLTSSEEIAMELAAKLQEVDDLKLELETCEQRLESKYQAIEILRKQAEEAQHRFKVRECSTREATMKLAQEINELQFEIISRDNMLATSQQVWAQRYDRMCQENMTLQDSLHLRTEQLRKVTSQKMAVERENDELLALLDIQERAKYELTRSSSTEEMYSSYSSTQLAVLGACRCRVSTPDPCGCALAAANLKKDIINMKQELCQYKTRRDEAYHTVDAYRQAFEEQLQKNKALTTQLANIGSGRSPTGTITAKSRAKLALHWLIGSLNDEELTEEEGPGCNMTEYELITYLTDMLNEKKEVLAHQKLATQILADRVKTLESQLAVFEKDGSKVVL
ncbi:hypothetical protein DPMN_168738 [Dreissena polymorpha]|uniref:Coiled-coil domain-containing protein 125 n=1 Tax=Dreissena polymorpha TaxID=45954 RepID=A0A9D4IW71_DREPO|nr:hypothetical protein DPMN_168738 [Dreissena polymorpha]